MVFVLGLDRFFCLIVFYKFGVYENSMMIIFIVGINSMEIMLKLIVFSGSCFINGVELIIFEEIG